MSIEMYCNIARWTYKKSIKASNLTIRIPFISFIASPFLLLYPSKAASTVLSSLCGLHDLLCFSSYWQFVKIALLMECWTKQLAFWNELIKEKWKWNELIKEKQLMNFITFINKTNNSKTQTSSCGLKRRLFTDWLTTVQWLLLQRRLIVSFSIPSAMQSSQTK